MSRSAVSVRDFRGNRGSSTDKVFATGKLGIVRSVAGARAFIEQVSETEEPIVATWGADDELCAPGAYNSVNPTIEMGPELTSTASRLDAA